MKRPKSLTAKLKVCDPEIKLYVGELEKINLKLHKQIAKLQAQNIDHKNEIKVLKQGQPTPIFNVNFGPSSEHKSSIDKK